MRILFTCYPGLGHLHPMLPLARAALRAGACTMLGALAAGVPQLLLPHGAEQHLNAEARRRAGAALVIVPDELIADV